jgi:glycosyltransferase involved in cell wall biosynthesis
MKVSGFTLVRNGVKYFYPFREAIESILLLCDEVIVNVGYSDDNTLKVVESIKSDKIKIVKRTWDMSLREGGKLLSVETNAALNECKGDWCFYIQADEVMHEKYIPTVKAAMEEYLLNDKVEGLRFRYKHFYGSYDYYQDNYRNWYIKEVRVIKNHRDIVSWGDAMDFRHKDTLPVRAVEIDAEIYHYGWVRPPQTLMMKRLDFHKLYHTDEEVREFTTATTNYDDLGNLKKFSDTHPAVMEERVDMYNWDFDAKLNEQKPDWIRKILIFLHPVIKRLKKLG